MDEDERGDAKVGSVGVLAEDGWKRRAWTEKKSCLWSFLIEYLKIRFETDLIG